MQTSRGVVDPTARLRYTGTGLDDDLLAGGVAPLPLLEMWYAEAAADHRVVEPGAMVVATVDANGRPNARTVLLKGLDARGLVFYTNRRSTKGEEIEIHPEASLVLLWHAMYRQVRARGRVDVVPDEEAAAYFASRPRGSQIGAWASRQSAPIDTRAELEARVADMQQRFGDVADVPMPPFWGGYRVRPVEVELWVGHASRLHDRIAFTTAGGAPAPLDDAAAWRARRLQP
jgi:pyridoxamine 5'-phosphate oxidase